MGIISVLSVVFLGWRYAKKEIAIVVTSTDFLLESYNPSCTEQTFFTFSFFVHLATIPKKKSDLPVAESRAVKILAENVKENDKTDEIHEQWLLAANVLNRFFISLFLIAVIITFIAVFTEDTRRLETWILLNTEGNFNGFDREVIDVLTERWEAKERWKVFFITAEEHYAKILNFPEKDLTRVERPIFHIYIFLMHVKSDWEDAAYV